MNKGLEVDAPSALRRNRRSNLPLRAHSAFGHLSFDRVEAIQVIRGFLLG